MADSKLKKNKGLTLREWCVSNGYPGVTEECILSAKQSNNPKVARMGSNAQMVSNIKQRKVYGR